MDTMAPSRPPKAPKKRSHRVSWTAITLISLAISGYFVSQYTTGSLATLGADDVGLAKDYAATPVPVQVVFYIHIFSAGLALVLGPFQFARTIRRRYLTVHRWIGRISMYAIGIAAASGLVMAFFTSAGFVGFFGFGTLSVLWAWTTYRGYRAIRERDIASHEAWMIRSFALTFAAPTLRLWLGVLAGAQLLLDPNTTASPELVMQNVYAPVPFLCWLPNIVIAEIIIRRRNLPGLRFSPSPTAPRAAPTQPKPTATA